MTSPTNHLPIHDIEVEGYGEVDVPKEFIPPDWDLMSPQGLMAVLQIAVSVFTKVCVCVEEFGGGGGRGRVEGVMSVHFTLLGLFMLFDTLMNTSLRIVEGEEGKGIGSTVSSIHSPAVC